MKSADAPVSASELSSATCLRKWSARYRWESWERRRGGYFVTGTLLHGMLEGYLTTGILASEPAHIRDMALPMLPHIPRPGTQISVEKKHTFEHHGVPYEVTADAVFPGLILDYKTSKDPKAYAVKEDKSADPQSMLYMFGELAEGGTFRHIYTRKTRQVLLLEAETPEHVARAQQAPMTPAAFAYEQTLSRPEIERLAAPHLALGAKLFQLRQKHERIDPLSLPHPDPVDGVISACNEYGGCEHRSRCWGPLGSYIAPPKALGGISMAFALSMKKPSISVPVPAPVSEPAPAPAPEAPASAQNAELVKLLEQAQAQIQTLTNDLNTRTAECEELSERLTLVTTEHDKLVAQRNQNAAPTVSESDAQDAQAFRALKLGLQHLFGG